jgi:hypothetical protein
MDKPTTKPSSAVRVEYRPLQKYLSERFSDAVVLTFGEIEDLLGATLPQEASLRTTWWTDAQENGVQSPQSHAWIDAHRNALPNLVSRRVRFERVAA